MTVRQVLARARRDKRWWWGSAAVAAVLAIGVTGAVAYAVQAPAVLAATDSTPSPGAGGSTSTEEHTRRPIGAPGSEMVTDRTMPTGTPTPRTSPAPGAPTPSPAPVPREAEKAPAPARPQASPPQPVALPRTAPTQPVAPSGPVAPTAPDAPSGDAALAAEVVRLVNIERADAGCGPVTASAVLEQVARAHSQDMADQEYFSHTSLDGRSPWDRLEAAGYSDGSGENIAAGQDTAQDVMTSWMNSDGHRANILNCDSATVGIGIAHGGSYGIYWTQVFGRS